MSTTGPVKWNDYDESRISISCNSDEIIGIRTSRDEGPSTIASVAIDRLPEFITALYAAAGKPEPVILDRPDGQDLNFRAIRIGRNGDAVLLAIGGNQEALSPLLTRELAANLVTLADEADNEPDPAEVEELQRLVCEHIGGSDTARDIARTVLRWMREREAGS